MRLSTRLTRRVAASLITSFLGATIALLYPGRVEAAPVVHILIVAGQSNAVGYGANANQLPPNLYKAQRNISYQHNISGLAPTTDFIPLRWLDDTGSAAIFKKFNGPEVSLGDMISAALPGTQFVVVKVAYNGTNLAYDWDPQRAGSLFFTLTQTVAAVQSQLTARGLSSVVDGMFWMQGESDATNLDWANAYEANLTAFIAECRTAFNAPLMPFVLGRINLLPGLAYVETVRAAEVAVADADPLTEWVDTDALPLFIDNLHFTAAGEVTLGDDMASAYLQLIDANENRKTPVRR
jgi:hypothetical protein